MIKKRIAKILFDVLENKLDLEIIVRILEIPPDEKLGDFAFPCFSLAKTMRKDPKQIAEDLSVIISDKAEIRKTNAIAGYLNIFLSHNWICKNVLDRSIEQDYGKGNINKKAVVEYCSPNTNKPLHLGHLRNMAIGESISRLLEYAGNKVYRTCVYNDRGVHICKSMLAYKMFGNGQDPKKDGIKSDHFVGKFYVLFADKSKDDESLENLALEMLAKWENGDKETVSLWEKMNNWAFEGFKDTFKVYGINFDKEYYESSIYKHGKEIVLDGLSKGLFLKREDGAIVADLSGKGLGDKVLLRSNGTSVYIVQDIYLAYLKNNTYSPDKSIYVVGNEQEYHFKALKAILEKLNTKHVEGLYHLSYGMVELPEGKMKSREGTVVDADDLIMETSLLASEEIKNRYELEETEIKERSLKIALAAIKYQLLKVETTKNMTFNPNEAIRFEGDTGPYLLYSYARASSILRKAEFEYSNETWDINEYELRLLKKLSLFPEIVQISCNNLTPSILATYSFELCQLFNQFHHECHVIHSNVAKQRLALVKAFRNVQEKCLYLLGIEKVEVM